VSKSNISASDEILDKFFRYFFSVQSCLSNQHEEVGSSGIKIVPRICNHGFKLASYFSVGLLLGENSPYPLHRAIHGLWNRH
jgi:hypothetical protein